MWFMFSVRLNSSSSYFRGFLIQARLATKHGHIVGGYRAGEFMLEDGSESKGVKYFACASALKDSITHSNDDKKTVIEAKWIEKKNEGPIQFLYVHLRLSDKNDFYPILCIAELL